MRTIVTGASGFIGKSLCTALSGAGHQPVAVSLRSEAPRFAGAHAVVHLAGIAHRAGVDAAELHRVNVALTEKVGRAAAEAGALLVFVSSVKVHGEESTAPLTESARIAPGDAYAESKARAEDVLRGIAGLRLAVLRPPLVYGPAVKANFLALMRAVARGIPLPFAGIENRRSLLYAGNLADAIVRCAERGSTGAWLVADGPPLSTPELCRRLAAALGRPPRLFPFPVALLELLPGMKRLTRSLEVDDAALRRALDWRPPFSFDQGLRATADGYL